jgi:hypothetical protein
MKYVENSKILHNILKDNLKYYIDMLDNCYKLSKKDNSNFQISKYFDIEFFIKNFNKKDYKGFSTIYNCLKQKLNKIEKSFYINKTNTMLYFSNKKNKEL